MKYKSIAKYLTLTTDVRRCEYVMYALLTTRAIKTTNKIVTNVSRIITNFEQTAVQRTHAYACNM